ncbi:MAG: nucleoside-diphosphate kinase, partial [Planctomycetota bacterium]|nr:nucleoside-diphosphate kinase [Planctomycetota bacterium]
AEHEGKDFYEPLLRFVTAGPTVFMVLEGQGAVAVVRKMVGATFGPDADPGTVRGDFGVSQRFNLVHGSDSAASAEKEIALFFREDELLDWDPATWPWHYDFSTGEAV